MAYRISLFVNSSVMVVFGVGSYLSQEAINNVLMYPNAYGDMPIPPVTMLAIDWKWIVWALPILWFLVSSAIAVLLPKDSAKATWIGQLHTSLTLLCGFTMLSFFVYAGASPFIPFVCGSG